MKLSELITYETGRLSHTKLWANVACAASTAVFLKQGWAGTLTTEGWMVYLGLVGGYVIAQRWVANRTGAGKGTTDAAN